MKKRWLILMLLIVALTLCACGAGDAEDNEGSNATVPVDAREGNSQLELFSNESCALTLESVGKNAAGDYCWTVSLTNKTGSELVFSLDNVYVNECEADPCWAEKVPAAQTTTSEVSWFTSTFADRGIRSADRVDFTLSVFPRTNATNLLAFEKCTVYPNGEAAYQRTDFAPGANDTILADATELLFAATGCDPDGERGYTLNIYMENRSNAPLEYAVKNEKINGQSCSTYWVHTLDAGKRSYDQISWDSSEFERMEIFTVSRIEFDLVVTDPNSNAKVLEQHCTVTP
ncbi:MAG: hypothetical protein IJJ99_00310 [Oscillospiraceae bacterium]|nr:hypothetical protein [Oscillospiraceae bacterium]